MLKLLGYLWALPNTLLALGITLCCLPLGARARWHTGVLEVTGGAVSWLLRKVPIFRGALALTLGHVVFGRTQADQDFCRRHERVHVRQYELWGPLFIPAYFIASGIAALQGLRAYQDNWFERHAFAEDQDDLHLTGSRPPV